MRNIPLYILFWRCWLDHKGGSLVCGHLDWENCSHKRPKNISHMVKQIRSGNYYE